MTTRHIAVVGPSGVGKDTLMRAAASAMPDVHLVRRAITRTRDEGSEDFEPVSAAAFACRRDAGGFVVHWQAHGLHYGVPHVAGSGISLMNLSRGVLQAAAAALPGLGIIHITADPRVLAQRLAGRGRETADDIAARIARVSDFDAAGLPIVTVDNSAALEVAETAFLAAIQELSR